jgi:hypothetical protein
MTHHGTLDSGKVVVAALMCLVLAASPAFVGAAYANSSQSQVMSLNLAGLITNAGHQHYDFSGGALVAGVVDGTVLDPANTAVTFSLDAMVHDLGTSGTSSLSLTADGGAVSLHAEAHISGEIPAAIFPINPITLANCDPTAQACNSEIPVLFTGLATVHLGAGSPLTIPIAIESPYWSPFGGPIVIVSLDSSSNPLISLVVTYNSATIDWTGVQLQGVLAGTLGGEGVTGFYTQVSNSHEDLLAGSEQDTHTISFVGMSDPVLNAKGTFSGLTSFSLAGHQDCASQFGLPEGTCTATGATSAGTFQMIGGQGAKITGTYATLWSVPSLFTQTEVVQH